MKLDLFLYVLGNYKLYFFKLFMLFLFYFIFGLSYLLIKLKASFVENLFKGFL